MDPLNTQERQERQERLWLLLVSPLTFGKIMRLEDWKHVIWPPENRGAAFEALAHTLIDEGFTDVEEVERVFWEEVEPNFGGGTHKWISDLPDEKKVARIWDYLRNPAVRALRRFFSVISRVMYKEDIRRMKEAMVWLKEHWPMDSETFDRQWRDAKHARKPDSWRPPLLEEEKTDEVKRKERLLILLIWLIDYWGPVPEDLAHILIREGYTDIEEVERLFWDEVEPNFREFVSNWIIDMPDDEQLMRIQRFNQDPMLKVYRRFWSLFFRWMQRDKIEKMKESMIWLKKNWPMEYLAYSSRRDWIRYGNFWMDQEERRELLWLSLVWLLEEGGPAPEYLAYALFSEGFTSAEEVERVFRSEVAPNFGFGDGRVLALSDDQKILRIREFLENPYTKALRKGVCLFATDAYREKMRVLREAMAWLKDSWPVDFKSFCRRDNADDPK